MLPIRNKLPALRFVVLATLTALSGSSVQPVLAQAQPAKSAEKPAADKAGAKPKEEKKLLKSKDFYLGGEADGKYEELARQKREEAIGLLKSILDSGNVEGDQLAEMKLRLAELYWETAKDTYLQEMTAHLERYGKWADSKDPNKGPEPKEDHSKSQQSNRQAIELYRSILQNHRNFERTDEVYFNLAFNLMDLGEKQQALDYYQALVKNYPQSEFVADAYLAMGEYWFDNNNAFKALGNYKKAATYPDSKVRLFALYKLAWCYYNVGEYQQAIDSMKQVITESAEDTTTTGKVSLKDEALNDLVLFYSDLGDMDAAYAYFTQFNDKKYFKAMLKRLGSTYMDQGKFDQAISTYRKLISEDPNAKDTPGFQNEVITAYFKQGRKDDTIAEIDRLANEYGAGSAWAKTNAGNKDAIGEANDLIERNLRQVAIDYHKEARKTGSPKTYELARRSYQKYLGLFPSNKFSYDIRFAYAEVLYELKEYPAAVDEYERVAQMDPKGKYFQVAASSLILTIDKILGWDKKAEEKEKEKAAAANATAAKPTTPTPEVARDLTPVPLNEWENRRVKASDFFATSLPDHKDSPAVLYEVAKLYYDRNLFDESTKRFMGLVERYPKHEVAEVSANLILDSYNLLQDWDRVNGYARQFYTNPNFKPEFKKELREIYELASYKRVEKLESGGQMKEAADAYAAFYAEFPQSTYGDKALFNAAFLYFKTNNTQKAVDMREKLIAGFPKSELMGKNIDALAKLYESFASFKKAADYYEMLYAWDKDKTYPGTADAIYSAALFRNSLGDWQKAIANFQIYARDFAAKDDAHIAAFEIGRIYEQNGKPVEAAATYKKFYTDPAFSSRSQEYTFHARLRYGKLLRAQGQLDASYAAFQEGVMAFEKVSRSGGQLGAAPLFAAEMKFYLVEPAYEKFAKLKLELPKKGQKGNALEEKLRMAEEVARQYTAVLELKQGEWGIAALYQIGETYRNVADTLLEAPAPPALTEQQLQIFKAALADKAYPLKDKAAEALEQALSKSYELGIYNEYTAKAAGLLAQLKPREYPEQFEVLGTPNKLSDTFVTADFRR